MSDITISLSTDLLLPLVATVGVGAIAYLGFKLKRLPHDFATGMATGLARFAKADKDSENYAAAYAQLSDSIETAWETKDPSHLLPLIGNPLVWAAYNTLKPALAGLGVKAPGGAEATDDGVYA